MGLLLTTEVVDEGGAAAPIDTREVDAALTGLGVVVTTDSLLVAANPLAPGVAMVVVLTAAVRVSGVSRKEPTLD